MTTEVLGYRVTLQSDTDPTWEEDFLVSDHHDAAAAAHARAALYREICPFDQGHMVFVNAIPGRKTLAA